MATKTAGKTAPAATSNATDFDNFLSNFKAKKSVTLSSWTWEDGEPKAFKVLGEVHAGSGGKKQGPPPMLCLVRDLSTGTHYQLILGKMIFDAFNESFPGDKIIGKCFAAVRYAVPDATWKRYDVREIDDPEPETEE